MAGSIGFCSGYAMKKQYAARVTGFLLAFAICAWSLASILEGLGTGGDLMLSLMKRYAPSQMTGLPEEEYAGMCGMITDYLAGAREDFQYQWTGRDSIRYVGFHDYEQQHMVDVRSLFVLVRKVLMISTAAGAACVGLLFWFRRRTATLQGLRDGAVAAMVLNLGFAEDADLDAFLGEDVFKSAEDDLIGIARKSDLGDDDRCPAVKEISQGSRKDVSITAGYGHTVGVH